MQEKKSVVKDSLLEIVDIPAQKFLLIVYKYLKNNEITEIEREVNVNRKTLGRFFNHIREIIVTELQKSEERIGGMDENGEKKNCRNR